MSDLLLYCLMFPGRLLVSDLAAALLPVRRLALRGRTRPHGCLLRVSATSRNPASCSTHRSWATCVWLLLFGVLAQCTNAWQVQGQRHAGPRTSGSAWVVGVPGVWSVVPDAVGRNLGVIIQALHETSQYNTPRSLQSTTNSATLAR